jgi:hypothetical protein
MKKSLIALVGAAALIVSAVSLHADVLRLKNGDILSGTITQREGGVVTIKGNLYGEVSVQESDVASFEVGTGVTAATTSATAAVPVTAAATAAAAGGVASATIPAAAAPAADPNKATWSRSLTVGGSYVSAPYKQGVVPGTAPGVTGAQLGQLGDQYSVQISGAIIRATAKNAISLEGSYTYADYEPYPSPVADTYSATLAWNHALSPRHYTVSRTSYMVDEVKNIDHSFYQIVGVGWKLIDTEATKLDIVPGLMLSHEKKNFVFDNQWEPGYGFLQNLTHAFNPAMSFEQRLTFRNLFEDAYYYTVDAYVGFKGMLSATIGVQVGVTYNYDNGADRRAFIAGPGLVFYPSNQGVLSLSTGFQFKF